MDSRLLDLLLDSCHAVHLQKDISGCWKTSGVLGVKFYQTPMYRGGFQENLGEGGLRGPLRSKSVCWSEI